MQVCKQCGKLLPDYPGNGDKRIYCSAKCANEARKVTGPDRGNE